ncbi:MAG: ATP-grasp fold amidoligase family protein [Candidatus Paceibacterota bacterium]
MNYQTNPSFFTFHKPYGWASMPLYNKIAYYGTTLHASYAPYVHKLSAKRIVKDLCGNKIHVASIIRILNGPRDIHPSDMNTQHIIKSIHSSGSNISIEPSTTIPECIQKLHTWNVPYIGIQWGEHQYKTIKPGFFIEEKIANIDGIQTGSADVYMFRCIKGCPITIGIKRGNIQNSYDINWNLIADKKIDIERPEALEAMIELAIILSAPFEFVRVDFYLSVHSTIYFSEFTFTPAAGLQLYSNQQENQLGALWQ